MMSRRSRLSSALLLAFAALGLGGFSGCTTPAADDPARLGPYFTPANHAGAAQLPANLRRVILLPLAGGTIAPPESALALDPVILTELQKKNRFEIVTVSRQDCWRLFHAEEFLSTAALPAEFIATLRRQYAADGVLFVDVTVYKPYRPIALGLRAKLAAVEEGEVRLLWTFDNVFSTADQTVSNSARHHFLESNRHALPGDATLSVLESPTRFASYVAAEMFATLPPVYTAGATLAAPAGNAQPR